MKSLIHRYRFLLYSIILLFASQFITAADGKMPAISGIRIEFILFAITLIGVAVFHHKTMYVALSGLAAILIAKYVFTDFSVTEHLLGTATKEGEWRILLNLLGLLFGFAILAEHFKESKLPDILPNYLPSGWKGGFILLFFIMVLSSFLDNIAAAMIGGTIAMVVFKGKVHIGFLAAIVAASNAVASPMTATIIGVKGASV